MLPGYAFSEAAGNTAVRFVKLTRTLFIIPYHVLIFSFITERLEAKTQGDVNQEGGRQLTLKRFSQATLLSYSWL